MTPYIYREVGGITGKEGNKIVIPEISSTSIVKMNELARKAGKTASLSEVTIESAISAVKKVLVELLSNGHSVELEGIGILTPSLQMKKDKQVKEQTEDGKTVTRNAQNIEFGTVKYRPSKDLIKECRLKCVPFHDLHVGNQKPMDTPLSLEERKVKLQEYLEEHPFIRIKDYMKLTCLRHTTANKELKSFCAGKEGILIMEGAGSHKYFTKRKTTQKEL